MTTCINEYNRKAVIQQLVGSEDAHGFVDPSAEANWKTYLPAWCKVVSKAGREFWKIQQVNETVSHVWYCQYNKTLAAATPDMRLVHDGKIYQILSVIDIDLQHQEIEIQTKQAVQ